MALLPPVVRGVAPPTGGYDSSDRKRSFLSDSSDHSDSSDRSDHSEPLCPPPPLYISLRGNSSDPILSRISTWKFSNPHVENKKYPRGREKILRRNQMKLRRNRFASTWRIFIFYVENKKYPRRNWSFLCRSLKMVDLFFC